MDVKNNIELRRVNISPEVSDYRQSDETSAPSRQNTVNWNVLAVQTENLNFKYGSGLKAVHVVKDVSLVIPEGAIYGLLGPSGGGKTSLLRCIVGRLKPDSGNIYVFGTKPGSKNCPIPGNGVGYMPQELALYNEFSISETIHYFGMICGMPKNARNARLSFLLKFLDLPHEDRSIKTLSGGQIRRVSLAAALVHCPPLLILDEPTVGVDPLLRESIWSHLVQLTKEKMTIIITTHYIEEAKDANIVAFFREGRLLVESSPKSLLEEYQVESLEKVFLAICLKNVDRPTTAKMNVNQITAGDAFLGHGKYTKKSSPINNIMALTHKSFIRLHRNIPVLCFQMFLPAIQIILFCTCIGKPPSNMKLAVYNPDTNLLNLSHYFFNSIDSRIKLIKHDSKSSALDSVKSTETVGALVLAENYTVSLKERVRNETNNQSIDASTIWYHGDFTESPIATVVKKILQDTASSYVHKLVKIVGLKKSLAQPLIMEADQPVYGHMDQNFQNFMAPGIILTVTYAMASVLTALTVVLERKEGLLDRSFVAGVKPYQILIAHIFVQFIIIVIQSSILLTFVFLVFKVELVGSIFTVASLTISQGIVGMSFGFMISSICHEEQSAMMLALGSFYPLLILSGIIWPLEGMPEWVQSISLILPQTMAIRALRSIIGRGWGFNSIQVLLGFGSTFCWMFIFNTLAIIIFTVKG